ncbi:MAG: DUF5679 domain-containing protein [Nitrososphaerales archaeon]
MVEGFCVKCKKKVEMIDPKQVELKNKRQAIKGTCPTCKSTVYRIGKL